MDTAALFGHIAGSHDGAQNSARLAAYAALDPLIPDEGFDAEFMDIIELLKHQLGNQKRRSNKENLLQIPISEMTAEQKQQLLLSLSSKQRKK